MNVRSKATELAGALKATAEFAELRQAKAAVDSNKALRTELENLKNRQASLYSGKLPAQEVKSRMTELDKAYGQLSGIPEFNRYLKAAKKFSELFHFVFRIMKYPCVCIGEPASIIIINHEMPHFSACTKYLL